MALGCDCTMGALPASLGFGRLATVSNNAVSAAVRAGAARGASVYARSHRLGALPASLGFGAIGDNPFAVASTAPRPVVLSPQVAQNLATAGQMMAAGTAPTPAQAVNIIKTAIPPQSAFKPNLPAPVSSGGHATASNLAGLGASSVARAYRSRLGNTSTVGASAAAGAAIGTVVPGVGNAIGGAVGAVVGIVEGLFSHKRSVPKVSPADVQQAQTWEQQYTQVAGSVVGRYFTASAIQDMITAMAIMNPGFWGRGTSTNIDVSAVNNFYGEEMTRLQDFFNAMQAAPVGATVTLVDDRSIPGHAKTNPNISYSFPNPGVNAPSYILGAYFAQYFYTMCTIYQSGTNCSGHLTAPFPQMHCDILDWFRSTRPQWDTPQPNVVTGADVSITAPTATTGGSTTASITTLAPKAGAAAATQVVNPSAPTVPPTSGNPTATPQVPAGVSPAPTQAVNAPAQPTGQPAVQTPSIFSSGSGLPSFIPGSPEAVAAGAQPQTSNPFVPAKAGFSWIELAVLGAVGIPLIIGMRSKH